MQYKNATIAQILSVISQNSGVDGLISMCVAWTESGFNAKALGDWSTGGPQGPFVPDGTPSAHATSFGLFQLHEGGELGSLTEAEALNPIVNASTAIPHIAAVAHEHPDWTPGQIAASAQGPANAAAYATEIDELHAGAKAGNYPTGWKSAIETRTGLTVVLNEPAPSPPPTPDPPPPPPVPQPSPKMVQVDLPELVEGVGMPPSQPNGAVRVVQVLLKDLWNISIGDSGVDGRFGPKTAMAVEDFQHAHNMAETGKVDAATWTKLLS